MQLEKFYTISVSFTDVFISQVVIKSWAETVLNLVNIRAAEAFFLEEQFEIFWGDIVKIVTTDQYCNTRSLLKFNIKENKIDSHFTSAISLLLWFGDIPGTFYKQEPFLITWFNFNPSMDK